MSTSPTGRLVSTAPNYQQIPKFTREQIEMACKGIHNPHNFRFMTREVRGVFSWMHMKAMFHALIFDKAPFSYIDSRTVV